MSHSASKIYFPNLDGLRFICFLSVFFFHSFATDYESIKTSQLYFYTKGFLFRNGNLGVNFFFVLSGFLITYLLLTEKEKYSSVNIRNFYFRRILRIWPLFYFCVFFGFVLFPKIKLLLGQTPIETAAPLYYISFLNNIDFVNGGLPDSSILGVLWSVAIEEQFYLIWPLIIGLLSTRNTLLSFVSIIGGTFMFRYVYADNQLYLEHHTFSCISDMAVGGLFGFLAFKREKFVSWISNAPQSIWITLYLIVGIVFLFRRQIFHHSSFLLAIDRLVISIIFAFVILEQNFANHSIFKMSKFKLISKLGTYTYGLYCLHMIGILIAAKGLAYLGINKTVYQVLFLEGLGSLAISICLAIISYHFFEKRFLTLKDKFALIKTSNAQSFTHTKPTGRRRPSTERHFSDEVPRS